eukprot:4842139-Prymnesium_polylepis.1
METVSMETDGLHAIFNSHSSRLHPSLCLPAAAPQRASEAMPLRLAGKRVHWPPPIYTVAHEIGPPHFETPERVSRRSPHRPRRVSRRAGVKTRAPS